VTTRIVELLRVERVFERQRKSDEIRALGILLIYLGLSCRQAKHVLECLNDVSHEAIRKWYHRAKGVLRQPSRKHRERVAIDETKIKIEGR